MSKKHANNVENLPTVSETLADMGLHVVPEPQPASDVTLPSWVTDQQAVALPPNLIEQLVVAHRERDAAYALYQQHENRRGGLFDGFLFAMGLPVTATYDLATGTATVPPIE